MRSENPNPPSGVDQSKTRPQSHRDAVEWPKDRCLHQTNYRCFWAAAALERRMGWRAPVCLLFESSTIKDLLSDTPGPTGIQPWAIVSRLSITALCLCWNVSALTWTGGNIHHPSSPHNHHKLIYRHHTTVLKHQCIIKHHISVLWQIFFANHLTNPPH